MCFFYVANVSVLAIVGTTAKKVGVILDTIRGVEYSKIGSTV